MRFLTMVHLLEGYVTIRAEGIFLERFLNICTRRELDIRNICHCGNQRLTAEISLSSFRLLRPICTRTQTRVRILKRHGLPFLLHRYRKRKFALIGLCLTLLLLWYTSGHIMGITVFGNQKISTETILSHLSRSGVALGQSARHLDSSVIRNQMMRDLDDLAWIGINVNGSRVYIEVVERLEKEPGVDISQPCNLVAARDGVIASIQARNGQTMVKPGEGVRQGDVLVSGIVDNPARGYLQVHAYGQVFAETRYTRTQEYPLNYQEQLDTGEKTSRYTLRLLNWEFTLFPGDKDPYTTSAVSESEREYRLPIDSFPSLFLRTKTYQEQIIKPRSRTPEEALETAKKELTEKLEAEISDSATVIDQELSYTLTERDTLSVSLTLICRENIAVEVPIEKPEE